MTVLYARYTSDKCELAEFVPVKLLTREWPWSKQRVQLLVDVYYQSPVMQGTVICPAGIYDGYSVPRIATWLTAGKVSPVMPGLACIFPHDVVCAAKQGTRKQRRELFAEAYAAAMRQFHKGSEPDWAAKIVEAGVNFGSKYCRYC